MPPSQPMEYFVDPKKPESLATGTLPQHGCLDAACNRHPAHNPVLPPLVLFAHGKESGAWGSKIRHLASIAERHGARVHSPAYSAFSNPDERVRYLLGQTLAPHDGLVLVGSSMGGYVSTVASATLRPAGLFLMAPAFYLPGYENQAPTSAARRTCVVSGWNDEVIPVEHSVRFAQPQRAELHLLDADHRLAGVHDELGEIFERFLVRVLALHRQGR